MVLLKKLFAYFMAFLMSLKTSTTFEMVKEKPYNNEVYKIAEADPPDYRAVYGMNNGEKIVRQCNTNKYASNGKRYADTSGYWFVNGKDGAAGSDERIVKYMKNGSLRISNIFAEQETIIAPFECKLATKSLANDCKHMKLTCVVGSTKYIININNMYNWYCDISRDEDELDHHTGDEQEGNMFRGGHVLGKATEKTEIEIRAVVSKSDKKLKEAGSKRPYLNDIDQFFRGTYDAEKASHV